MLEAVWQGVVELGHGAVQAVQRDGWQQQQRGSGGGGAARSRRSSAPEQTRDGRPSNRDGAPEVLHHSAPMKVRTRALTQSNNKKIERAQKN